MSRKTRKRKKKKKASSRIAILLVAVAFGSVAVVALYQSQVQNGGSREAQDYFEVVSAGVDTGEILSNETWKLTGISLTFKAAGGDAHEVVIQSWAGSEPILVGAMRKDIPRTVGLISSRGYITHRKPEGFPVEIRITCLEASGKFKFYLTD